MENISARERNRSSTTRVEPTMQNKKRHKDRQGWVGQVLMSVLLQPLIPAPVARAQSSEVTVTGTRDADIQPLMQIDPEDLQSYGTSSIQDLLDALGPRIQSSMSDAAPVILINGRLAGATELKNLPPEAIARVDVLPEKAALRYGFPDDRRVVNLILREHFSRLRPSKLRTVSRRRVADRPEPAMLPPRASTMTTRRRCGRTIKRASNFWKVNATSAVQTAVARTLEPTLHDTKLAATFVRELLGPATLIRRHRWTPERPIRCKDSRSRTSETSNSDNARPQRRRMSPPD